MSGFQKGFALLVGLGVATTLTLPDRQTAKILGTGLSGLRGLFGTLISGKA